MTDTYVQLTPEEAQALPPPTARVTVSRPAARPEIDDWVDETPQNPVPTTTSVVQAGPNMPANIPPSPPSQEDEEDWGVPSVIDKDINQKGGAPFSVRTEMARAQNPDEAQRVLDMYYGPGNYGQDRSGNWWVMQDGKPTAVFPSGMLAPRGHISSGLPEPLKSIYEPFEGIRRFTHGPMITNTGAYLAASATPTAGATTGAAIGAPFGGPLGAAVGAGLGAAAGYSVDQLVKWYRGLFSQKPLELTKNMAMEGSLNALMTGAGPTVANVGRRAANRFRDWVGVSDTSARMTGELTGAGARPPIRSVAPEFRSWGDKQVLRNIVAGDPWEATNTQYIHDRLKQSLRSSGVPEAEIDDIISGASNPTVAPTRRTAGELVVQRSQQHVGDLQASAMANRQRAEQALRGHEQTLRTWAQAPGRNMEMLSEDVAETLIRHRQEFGRAAGREYRAIDALNGDERVFNLEPAWARARQIIDLADPGSVPPYLRQMMARYDDVLQARASIPRIEREIDRVRAAGGDTADLERSLVDARTRAHGNMTTFSEGHEMRTNLRELQGHEFNPTRTPWMNKLGQVESQLDDTFRAMEGAQGLPGQAAQRLRAMDEQYRRGIQVFKDAQVNKLIRDIKSGVGVDPEAVASTILQMGHTASGRRLLNLLPAELRENVARADMRNIIEEASRRNANGVRELDGMAFLDALENRKRAGLIGDLHSPQALQQLRDLGHQLAVLDGRITNLDVLPLGGISDAIRATITNIRQIDAFVKGNPVGAMVQGTPQQVDRAVRILSMPGNEAQTINAARFLGVDSPEWQAVQRSALQHLIRGALIETPAARMTVSGPAIERVLKKYTNAQQELLFPGGLADDLREVAKQAKFLFPNEAQDMAQSLAAKSITLHTGINILNPRTAYADMRYIYTATMGWLTDRPQVLRFLSNTAKKNPSEARAMVGFIARSLANAQMMGPGRGRPTPQEPQ